MLESYLKHVLRTFPIPPPQFLNFINYQYYDVVGVTQALASRLFHVGEKILASNDPAILSVVQMYCITRRLKLPLEKRSSDTSLDVANLYEFVNRLKHLKVVSDTPDCRSSSVLSELKFDLSIFRNLHSLQLEGSSMQQVEGWALLFDKLELLVIRNSAKRVSEAIQHVHARKEEQQGSISVFSHTYKWKALTHLHLARNYLREIDESITLVPYLQLLNLSHNQIEEVPELFLTQLHELTILDLSHNKLEQVDSLHTKLGNIHTLDLSYNRIRSLVGLRKLYCVVILNLKFNSIDDLSYLSYLGKLPCLESLQLDNNPICYQTQYRIEVFRALAMTYESLVLDGFCANQKEFAAVVDFMQNRPIYSSSHDANVPPAVDARRVPTRRVVAMPDERGREGQEERQQEGAVSDRRSLRVATEQLRDKEGKNWLSHYNEQLERETVHATPVEPSATGQLPPSKAQGYLSPQETDIRQASVQLESDLTPAPARVSHVTDLDNNSESEEQLGRVFMVGSVMFPGSLQDLRELEESALLSLLCQTDESQHESLVVKIDLDSSQILFVSLDNTRSESPKNFSHWRTICVLPSYPTTVCIEESKHSNSTCLLLCLSSNEEAESLCGLLHELVAEVTSSEIVSSQVEQPSHSFPSPGEELTSTMRTLFATRIKGLYSKEGFYSTRIASELLGSVYYTQDLVPGSPLEISRLNTTETDTQEEELLFAARVGFLVPLSCRDEFYSVVLLTNKAVHVLEVETTLSSLLLGETSHLITVRLCEISKLTIGLFDQSIRFECRSLGPLGVFTLFTRVCSITQGLQNCLKEVLVTARLIPEIIDSSNTSPSHRQPASVQIEYQGTEHTHSLKRLLFLHSIKDTYNSMEPGDIEDFCEEGVNTIEILLYLIVDEHRCVGAENILQPVSLVLTKQMLYIGIEDYNETSEVKQITPFFQVLRSQPVSALDNIELFAVVQTETRLESEVNLYFEGIEQSGHATNWKLFIADVALKQQFISTLKKLWKDEFSRDLKTSSVSVDMSSPLLYNYRSLKQKFHDRPHIVMPQELVDFAWQGARSPSSFLGIMKRLSPPIKQRKEQIAYLILTWCTPYSKPQQLIPTCVILTDVALYLCTTQEFYSLTTDKSSNSDYTVCLYDSINLVQIQEVVLGLFDYHFRLDTNYSTNTYAFLTFDNRQTSAFLSHLSDKFKKMQNPILGQEDVPCKEVSELDAKFSLTEVLLSSPSDVELQILSETLEFEARKLIPAQLLEGSSSIFSYILVLFDIGESNMQPHAILLTGQALFLCRIDLVRWPIAKFVVSPPATIQYEVVDVLAFEWIERVELASFKSPAFELVFTAQRNAEVNEDTNSNSGSEECIDLSQPMTCSCRWRLMTKDYKQRNLLVNALDGVRQGRDKRPINIQLTVPRSN